MLTDKYIRHNTCMEIPFT